MITMKLYHGTSSQNAQRIMQDGFALFSSDQAVFGQGVYFTADKDHAKQYYGDHVIEIDFPAIDKKTYQRYGMYKAMTTKECFVDSSERPLRVFTGIGDGEDEKWAIMFELLRDTLEKNNIDVDPILKHCGLDAEYIGWDQEADAFECLVTWTEHHGQHIHMPSEDEALQYYIQKAATVRSDMLNSGCPYLCSNDDQCVFFDLNVLNALPRKLKK